MNWRPEPVGLRRGMCLPQCEGAGFLSAQGPPPRRNRLAADWRYGSCFSLWHQPV